MLLQDSPLCLELYVVSSAFVVHTYSLFPNYQWGEYRDRRKRWQYAEQRSRLTGVDREKAERLQREFQTRTCPICLEYFDFDHHDGSKKTLLLGNSKHPEEDCLRLGSNMQLSPFSYEPPVTESYVLPQRGADGRRVKLLRCGHIFCESCWKSWVHSGCGNPCNCPVCRQDVGRAPQKLRPHSSSALPNTEATPLLRAASRRSARSAFL